MAPGITLVNHETIKRILSHQKSIPTFRGLVVRFVGNVRCSDLFSVSRFGHDLHMLEYTNLAQFLIYFESSGPFEKPAESVVNFGTSTPSRQFLFGG